MCPKRLFYKGYDLKSVNCQVRVDWDSTLFILEYINFSMEYGVSPQHPSCLFFQYNTQLGPPYHILVDTNFINFSIKAKLDLVQSMMDCLYAKCIPCITDCVMAEIEKLGQKYRVALRIAKDPRFERLLCTHKGTYADDCLVQRVTQHKCYIVATVDRDLK
ncbi:hypothetical protein M91_05309 [Bos mutus]|uniref:PIN domain-containing protein n=1 Tax=Bos mutus TaxID=72004 RepID=L8HTC0_9CETA|nr:hypothetical protein M91_05309 [Bos mutus]